MALSIGPNQSILSSISTRNAEQGSKTIGNSGGLTRATLRTNSEAAADEVKSEEAEAEKSAAVQAEERRAGGILFNASSSLVLKQNTAESLLATVSKLQEKSKEIERETNPTRKAKLEEEAEELLQSSIEEYEQAVAQTPVIAENETISAVLASAPNPTGGPVTFTTSILAVSSPQQLGLDQVNFSNPQAAQTVLSNAAAGLQNTLTSLQSSTTNIAAAVQSRGSAIAAQENFAQQAGIDERSTALADEIAASAEAIVKASPVELLNVQSLLAVESLSSRSADESARGAAYPAPRFPEREGLFSSEAPATAGQRLVQN